MYQPQPTNAESVRIVPGGPATTAVVAPGAFVDKIRWGAVWGGLMTSLTLFLVMDTFFFWIGVLGATPTRAGLVPSMANAWLPPILALVAFFFGGWLASASVPMESASIGVLNGFIVWALGTVVVLAFTGLVSSVIFGPMSMMFNGAAAGRGTGLSVQAAAGWTLLFLVLSACAAMLGGWVGASAKPRTTVQTAP